MSVTTVTRRYTFEAGHWLPKVREGHKCARPHGHNYVLDVTVKTVTGYVRDDGFVIDFWDLDDVVDPVIVVVDHRMLNEVAGLENPTAEYIASWFFNKIRNALPRNYSLINVRVYETSQCWADFVG